MQERQINMPEMQSDIKYIVKSIDEIKVCVFGEGSNPGLKGDVNILKQKDEARRWHFRTIYVALTGVIGELIFNHFIKRG